VLERIVGAAREQGATDVVRLTADCPLIDPGLIDDLVDYHIKTGADYTANCLDRTLPDGLDAEAATMAALEKSLAEAADGYELEHVTPYIRNHPEIFRIRSLTYEPDLSELRWTVDYREDLEFVRTVFENIYPRKPDFTYGDVLDWLEENPGAGRRQEDAQR
jgi:spore coat polysaccharide biosynthesis protein SpsF